jgi:hypothetical protein
MNTIQFKFIHSLFISLLVLTLVACDERPPAASAGGMNTPIETGGGENDTTPVVEEQISNTLSGSVGDGPIVGATIKVYDKNYGLLAVTSSDSSAFYKLTIKTSKKSYPIIVEATGGVDLVTNAPADFTLKSVAMTPKNKSKLNINPFSTVIAEVALAMSGGLTADNFTSATTIVLEKFSFGLDRSLVPDPNSTHIDSSNVATIVKASETMGEAIRRSYTALQTAGYSFSHDNIIEAIAADFTDGALDGRGELQALPVIAATVTSVSAQVLTEAITNQLTVGDIDAAALMDQAIRVIQPDAVLMTDSVPITAAMVRQTRLAVQAILTIQPSEMLSDLDFVLQNIVPLQLASDVQGTISVDASNFLDGLIYSVSVSDQTQLDKFNSTVGRDIVSDPEPTPEPTPEPSPILVYTEIAASSDDAEESQTGGMYLDSSDLELIQEENDQTVGIRYSLDIPKSATIQEAYLQFSVDEVSNTATSLQIQSEKSDDAALFTATANDISSRIRNSNSVLWVPESWDAVGERGVKQRSPDLSPLIQGVVNRANWKNGNHIAFIISGSGQRIAVSFDGNSAMAALLTVVYTSENKTPTNNNAPEIIGDTQLTIDQDSIFNFTPDAMDRDGDELIFSVNNLPGWALFDSATGSISGTPQAADVGLYSNIEITVSDGSASATLSGISITVNAVQQEPVLTSITGYSIYMGETADSLTLRTTLPMAASIGYTSSLSGAATYHFAVIAKDNSGADLTTDSGIGGYRILMGSSENDLNTSFDLSNGPNGLYWLADIAPSTYFLSITAYDLNGDDAATSAVARIEVL